MILLSSFLPVPDDSLENVTKTKKGIRMFLSEIV